MKWTVVVLLAICGIACSFELEFPENLEELREFHERRSEYPDAERREASDEQGSFEELLERRQAGSCLFKGKTYKDGETFKDACNTCRCVNGRAACTLMACPGCTHNGIYYNPRTSFQLDTTTNCTCFGQDRIGCREIPTPGLPSNRCYYKGRSYNPGDKYKKSTDCNMCTCIPGNVNFCSRVNCRNLRAGCVHMGKRYRSGQKFVDGCNVCACLSNFLFCTEMQCI